MIRLCYLSFRRALGREPSADGPRAAEVHVRGGLVLQGVGAGNPPAQNNEEVDDSPAGAPNEMRPLFRSSPFNLLPRGSVFRHPRSSPSRVADGDFRRSCVAVMVFRIRAGCSALSFHPVLIAVLLGLQGTPSPCVFWRWPPTSLYSTRRPSEPSLISLFFLVRWFPIFLVRLVRVDLLMLSIALAPLFSDWSLWPDEGFSTNTSQHFPCRRVSWPIELQQNELERGRFSRRPAISDATSAILAGVVLHLFSSVRVQVPTCRLQDEGPSVECPLYFKTAL